jgi:signal transduction histidine kinase/ActR/RegA family two-component response regulator
MPQSEKLDASSIQDPQHLVVVWRQQRAYRVGKILCYCGVPLSLIATIADYLWSPYWMIFTDFILLFGCVISLLWIKKPTRPTYYWWPMYVGFWLSALPTLWMTGGLQSPFFGIALVSIYVIGVVMDVKSRSYYYLAFSLLHVLFFYLVSNFFTLPNEFTAPTALIAVITCATFIAIFFCIHALLKNERDLSFEFSEHYKNLIRTEEQLRISDQQLREAQSIARIGSWKWDLEKDLIFWSDELFKIFEVPKESFDPSFKAYINRLNPEVRDRIHGIIQNSIETGKDFSFENKIQSKNGETLFIHSRGRAIKDAAGQVVSMTGTSQDVTDRKRIEYELMQARNEMEKRVEERTLELAESLEREKSAKIEAENASQAKMQFLANMSHEIRTPMNSILGFSDLLTNENHSAEERSEYLARISSSGAQLMHLIDDILDLSKFEAGQIPIHKSSFSLKPLIEEVISSFLPTLKAKQLELQLDYEPDIPEHIYTDAHRLNQILINLLNNAIKFSEKGAIKVIVSRLNHETGMQLCIHIKDTGIGISPENQKNLFQAFSQGDSSIARKFGGSGLGLVLSRRIAEALGGGLELKESVVGEGSHFLCKIFIDPVIAEIRNAMEYRSNKAKVSHKHIAGKKILLVEDSPDNAFLISLYIKPLLVEIHLATDGLQAVKMATQQDYACILMDIQMPGLDGLEATRRIRKQGFKKPIIALTAHALASEAAKSFEAGCNLHLTKPIDRNLLINTISEQLKKSKRLDLDMI